MGELGVEPSVDGEPGRAPLLHEVWGGGKEVVRANETGPFSGFLHHDETGRTGVPWPQRPGVHALCPIGRSSLPFAQDSRFCNSSLSWSVGSLESSYREGTMNSYLSIAQKVLLKAREPMDPRQILDAGYHLGIVPPHLFGKTQHKTLQARLAEDILLNKNRSEFIRTAPGRFFLRVLLKSTRRNHHEFIAPVRADQLKKYYVACFDRTELSEIAPEFPSFISTHALQGLQVQYHRLSQAYKRSDVLILRIFILFLKYDSIMIQRAESGIPPTTPETLSLGMTGFVRKNDYNLFSTDMLGVDNAVLRTLSERLHIDTALTGDAQLAEPKTDRVYINISDPHAAFGLASIVSCECDNFFDTSHHALPNTYESWSPINQRRNDTERFDVWSRFLFESGQLLRFKTPAMHLSKVLSNPSRE